MLVLTSLALLATAAIYFYRDQSEKKSADVYVSLPVKMTVGNGQMLVGKFSLVVSAQQEEGIRRQEQKLKTIVAAALTDIFSGSTQPALAEVQESLFTEINRHLPKKLRVRDLLIQDLVKGLA